MCSYAAIHREVVNISDVYASSRFDFSGPRQYDSLTGYRTQSQLVVPLVNNENELIGVLQLINAMDEAQNVIAFDEQYELIIRSLGAMAAIELTNLSYVEALKTQIYSFVEALTTALEERTPYNAQHTRNVERYASMLADYINDLHAEGKCEEFFEPGWKEQLMLAALIHDIGKMVIPLNIMNKATRLDQEIGRVDDRFKLLHTLYEVDMLRGRITQEEYEQTSDGGGFQRKCKTCRSGASDSFSETADVGTQPSEEIRFSDHESALWGKDGGERKSAETLPDLGRALQESGQLVHVSDNGL